MAAVECNLRQRQAGPEARSLKDELCNSCVQIRAT